MPDSRNLFLAIGLSLIVLIGWQYFFVPQHPTAVEQPAATQPAGTGSEAPAASGTGAETPAGQAPGPAVTVAPTLTREQALALSPRVPIETGAVRGSIALKGARLDDLHLNEFHETVDTTSPTIVLLSPAGTADGYFAELGWTSAAGGPAVPKADTLWTAPAGAKLTPSTPVTLTYDNGAGLDFTRTIAIDDKYMFTVTDGVTNKGTAPVSLAPYGQVVRLGEPHTAGYFILHEGLIGVTGSSLQEYKYKDLHDKPPVDLPKSDKGWLGITDKYWATTLIPEQGKSFSSTFAQVQEPTLQYRATFQEDAVTVAPGASVKTENRVFAGAKQVAVVDGYEKSLGIDRFELLIDWGWFYFITKPMFYLIDWFFHLFGNFGLAILAVTVLVKAVFFPLANKSYKSMSAMKKVQPQMAELRERYKDDKVKQQQELMALYKREKINPLAGCWPMALQIPVFFSLYKVLFVTIEMRHAPFFGWIQDLSAPDPTHIFNLFGLIPWTPPGLLAIGIWPIIMGITMFVQMRLNPPPADPAQQMIFTWMPLIFTFMLASFPAGLVIYWAWNNTLSVTQQYFIMRRQGVDVDLLGNIKAAFRRPSKVAAEQKAKAEKEKATLAAPKAANDAEPVVQPRKQKQRGKQKGSPKAKPSGADA
jgi:YidC/Oxa1 family membrane protein insertase